MAQPAAVRYPGIPAVLDGSEAIAHVEVRISEAACAYPIPPSTTMAAKFQANARMWMNLNLTLALVMVLMGGMFKFVKRQPKGANPPPAAVSSLIR